jgi:hypothetical protein
MCFFLLLSTSFEKAIDNTDLGTYGPHAHRILLHQTFICGEQQNLQCIVIAHASLMN